MATKKRLRTAERSKQIAEVGVKLAEAGDYKEVSARAIGEAIGIAASSVIHHFKTMTQLRRAIMREAVRSQNVTVIAQGIRDGHDQASKAQYDTLQRATELAESWT